MRGHQQIIDMRKEGYKPKSIFVQAGFEPVVTCRFDDPDRAFETKQFAEVWISNDEMAGHVDLRFVIGCRLHVHAERWSEELMQLLDRLVEAQPLQIVVLTDENDDMMIFEHGEWMAYASACA